LIWDGASYHKYGEFRDFLLEVNGDKEPENWSITCILFAPNAPQQNPVEDIWLQAKSFLRKYWYLCRSFKIVKFLFNILAQRKSFRIARYLENHLGLLYSRLITTTRFGPNQ
jgi:transposase